MVEVNFLPFATLICATVFTVWLFYWLANYGKIYTSLNSRQILTKKWKSPQFSDFSLLFLIAFWKHSDASMEFLSSEKAFCLSCIYVMKAEVSSGIDIEMIIRDSVSAFVRKLQAYVSQTTGERCSVTSREILCGTTWSEGRKKSPIQFYGWGKKRKTLNLWRNKEFPFV